MFLLFFNDFTFLLVKFQRMSLSFVTHLLQFSSGLRSLSKFTATLYATK